MLSSIPRVISGIAESVVCVVKHMKLSSPSSVKLQWKIKDSLKVMCANDQADKDHRQQSSCKKEVDIWCLVQAGHSIYVPI